MTPRRYVKPFLTIIHRFIEDKRPETVFLFSGIEIYALLLCIIESVKVGGVQMKEEKSAGGIVLLDEKALILRRFSGDWVLPKGHIEEGETPEIAAMREVREETGISASKIGRASCRERV